MNSIPEWMKITMPHDDLVRELGADVAAKIEAAGFVLVPRTWRERAWDAMSQAAKVSP
jgi:hypothetical protein